MTRDMEDLMLHSWAEERVTGFYLRSTALQGAKHTIARAHAVRPTLYYSLLRYKCEVECVFFSDGFAEGANGRRFIRINDRCESIGRFAPCFTEPVVLDEGCMLYGRRVQELPRPGPSPLRIEVS